eukprot:COSAG01_NODE_814_length_13398_cov_4.254230_6_plen_324_part_00
MIIVTGGAGFIGSAMVWQLNQRGIRDILIVDELEKSEKWLNLRELSYHSYQHKDVFLADVIANRIDQKIEAVIHMGACSATTELDMDYLMQNNVEYSMVLARWALEKQARFIYASSAATYGNGEHGFDDTQDIAKLRPINRYGYSKQLFDLWAQAEGLDSQIVGLKFFNVFGPNEYHKGAMKSVVCKAVSEIQQNGQLNLFKSYHPDYKDGEQKRDFIYVKDCTQVMDWFLQHPKANGLFNLGAGAAKSWLDLANAVFMSMDKQVDINFIDMPDQLKLQYQYFTQASMSKLKAAGYNKAFLSLDEAVKDYVQAYLLKDNSRLT